jgi:hypothetical protein
MENFDLFFFFFCLLAVLRLELRAIHVWAFFSLVIFGRITGVSHWHPIEINTFNNLVSFFPDCQQVNI